MAFSGRLAASFARLSWYSWAEMPGVTEIVSESSQKHQEAFYILQRQVCEGVSRAQAGQTGILQQTLKRNLYEAGIGLFAKGWTMTLCGRPDMMPSSMKRDMTLPGSIAAM
jgi:hypothetical protein